MVNVNKDTCIGCGSCAATCGEVFEMKEDGKSHVIKSAKGNEECIKEAMENCPVDAISA